MKARVAKVDRVAASALGLERTISPSLSLRHPSRIDQNRIRGFKKRLRMRLLAILAQSLSFKAPNVWDDRWPRPGVKHRSPC